jgi:hypothetical protein
VWRSRSRCGPYKSCFSYLPFLLAQIRLRYLVPCLWSSMQPACILKPVSHPSHFKPKDSCNLFLQNSDVPCNVCDKLPDYIMLQTIFTFAIMKTCLQCTL